MKRNYEKDLKSLKVGGQKRSKKIRHRRKWRKAFNQWVNRWIAKVEGISTEKWD